MDAPRPVLILVGMARRSRFNCPGLPFHVTARVQGRATLFEGLEPHIVRIIDETTARSDVQLLAYAVMPNHLHLIVVQGKKPLGVYMQLLLRRIALLVQRRHRCEGHVFERRYHAEVCRDAEYFRTAIVYVHLNPVRAGLCLEPDDRSWTSHHEYVTACTQPSWVSSAVLRGALPAFATTAGNDARRQRDDYLSFVKWRRCLDRQLECPNEIVYLPGKPCTSYGDDYWSAEYGAAAGVDHTVRGYRADLRDMALKTLAQFAPGMELEHLCSGGRTHMLVAVRRQLIARARLAGYRTAQIARFLNVSSTVVSNGARLR